jgi:hypothetical protein
MRPTPATDTRRPSRPARLVAAAIACAGLLTAVASPAAAQVQTTFQIPFTRPEAWALAHFTAATLLSGLETPVTRRPGDVSIGLELGWLPALTPTEELVGFDGIDSLDLNQAPLLPRPRVTIGLPAHFAVIVAAVPPVPMYGLKAALLAVGLERPLIEKPRWTVGLRGYGQVGWVRGAYTCPASLLAFPPGSPQNMMGCDATSSDTASLRYVGGEASVAYRTEASSRFSPHASIGINDMDVGFQVDALTYGSLDHTHYLSHGTTVSTSAGVNYRLTSRFDVGVDMFYSPLSVRRAAGAPIQTDGLFNVRALFTYRLR